MKIVDKIREGLNDRFRTALPEAFKKMFSLELETSWSLCDMRLVSRRADGKRLTKTQKTFMETFEAGYMAAWDVVTAERR